MTSRDHQGGVHAMSMLSQVFGSVCVAGVLLLNAVGADAASSTPFDDAFDYADGTSLDGTNGWAVTGNGSATTTNGQARLMDATLVNAFGGGDEAVTITFDLQPQFMQGSPASAIPADASFVFYVKTNGLITAYNGATPTNLTHTALSENSTTQIQVRVDHPLEAWSLWLGSTEIATDFGFYGAAASTFTEVGFTEIATNAFAALDNVNVTAALSSLPPTVSFLTNGVLRAASESAVLIPVVLYPVQAVTVTVAHAVQPASTATFNADYTNYTPSTITFNPGETSKTITFTVAQDQSGEPDETVIVGLSEFVNAGAGNFTNFTYIIEADEILPAVLPFYEPFDALAVGPLHRQSHWVANGTVVQTNEVYLGDKAAGMTLTTDDMVRSVAGTETNVWTDLLLMPAFGQPPSDPPDGSSFAFYVNTNGHIMVFDGLVATQVVGIVVASNTWVRFTVHSDYTVPAWDLLMDGVPMAEGLDFFDTNATQYSEFGIRGAGDTSAYVDEIRIQTEEPLPPTPLASFAMAGASGAESDADVLVTVTLSRAPTNAVQVNHFLAGGSATDGQDFTNYVGGTLNFAVGQTSTSFTFSVINDTQDESNETVVFGLDTFVNSVAGRHTSFTYTILHDVFDDPPVISFLSSIAQFPESAAAASIPVQLFPPQTSTVRVDHAVLVGSTALFGADYTNYTAGTLTFAPGETNKAITFAVVQDAEEEDAETILFELSNFDNAGPGAITEFTYVIGDLNQWFSLPFKETFDSRALGALEGQRGWRGVNATVQNAVVLGGAKALELSTLTNSFDHPFVGDHTSVWTDMYAKPVFGQPAAPPQGSTFAFYVTTNGVVMAYDGSSARAMPYKKLVEGQWVRFSVHSDYVNKNWELFVNNLHVGFDLGFRDAGATGYSEFGTQYAAISNGHLRAYFDNIDITLKRPVDLSELLIIFR